MSKINKEEAQAIYMASLCTAILLRLVFFRLWEKRGKYIMIEVNSSYKK